GAAQRRAGGDGSARRVDGLAALVDFVVQVRAGRQAGGADIADDVALRDLHAAPDAGLEALHVGVGGFVAVGVANLDVVAVAAVAAREHHRARACGHDGRAGGGGEVHALVHAGVAQHRVAAHAEFGRNARPVNGRAHQQLLDGGAVGVEELAALVLGFEPGQLHVLAFAAALKVGVEQAAALFLAGFGHLALVNEAEAIAGGDFAGEVHAEGERLDVLIDDAGGHAELAGCDVQAAADFALHPRRGADDLDRHGLDHEVSADVGDLHVLVERGAERQHLKRAGVFAGDAAAKGELQGGPARRVLQFARRADGLDDLAGIRAGDARTAQNGLKRGVAGQRNFLPLDFRLGFGGDLLGDGQPGHPLAGARARHQWADDGRLIGIGLRGGGGGSGG